MARDNQLKFTFSTVSAGTNLVGVLTTLGGRSGALKLVATANNWAVGYSDALLVTRFRDQTADQSLLVSQTVTSAIVGDNPVIGSTSDFNYYLRAIVGVAGMFGPSPCQIIVQGNDGVAGAAPSQTDSNWLPVSSIGSCLPNCTASGLTTSGTTGGFTVASGSASIGSVYIPSAVASSGLSAGTPYLVGSSGTLYTLAGAALSALTTANATTGVIGQFGVGVNLTVSAFNATTQVITADSAPNVGDFVTVVTAGTWTSGPAAAATYVVDSVNTAGGFTVKVFGSTSVTAFGAFTSGTVFLRWNFDRVPYVTVSNTLSTTNTFATTAGAAGSQAAGHGLQVGSIVYLYSGTVTGMSADQPYFVNSVPSSTTFTVSATINGSTLTVSSPSAAIFAVQRASKIVNVQITKTARAWMRVALMQNNITTPQVGYATFINADLSVGRDSAQVA